jgi:hypothetical protein
MQDTNIIIVQTSNIFKYLIFKVLLVGQVG